MTERNFSNAISRKEYRNGTITTDAIYPVLGDKHGNIWIHNWGFISVYHPFTGRINRIKIADDSGIRDQITTRISVKTNMVIYGLLQEKIFINMIALKINV
ncbi:MAG: hypothetical protein WKG06_18825 [Segetibacter sp.]